MRKRRVKHWRVSVESDTLCRALGPWNFSGREVAHSKAKVTCRTCRKMIASGVLEAIKAGHDPRDESCKARVWRRRQRREAVAFQKACALVEKEIRATRSGSVLITFYEGESREAPRVVLDRYIGKYTTGATLYDVLQAARKKA